MNTFKITSLKCKLLIVVSFILIHKSLLSQCISGDCANGKGKAIHFKGIYEGEFKDSLPHGKGRFSGIIWGKKNNDLDSVNDVGIFYEGFFMKGERTILATWERYVDIPKNQHYASKYPKIDGYFVVPTANPKQTFDYPLESYYKRDDLNKKQVKGYEFVGTYQHKDFFWYGKFKKGLMHGEGEFGTLNGGIAFFAQFDEGKPVGETIKISRNGSLFADPMHLTKIIFTNGRVTTLKYLNNTNDTLIKAVDYSLFYNKQGFETDTECTIKYKNGNHYFGDVDNAIPHGYGVFQQKDGLTYKGYYFRGYPHGIGKLMNGETIVDSGTYVYGKLMKGIFSMDNKLSNYPICLSGNCENGFGKANYSVGANKNIIKVYEGNFINGLPFGFGEMTYQNGKEKYTKKGTFSAGQLMGNATITANFGNLLKIEGQFKSDTLLKGTLDYSDGSKYESEKTFPIVFGIHKEKRVTGIGTYYTKIGSIVKGEFYEDISNKLFKGQYRRADGVVFNFSYNDYDIAKQYGVARFYDIDDLDNMATAIIAKKEQLKADREREMAIYAYEVSKRKQQAADRAKPENWKDDSSMENCGSCNGNGGFTYKTTYGGGETTTYVDSRGGYVSGGDKKTGRTYTTNVRCTACNGKGKLLVKSKKYIGPT